MTTKGRITSNYVDNHLEISIKVLRNPYVYIPLLLTAAIWAFGLSFLVNKVSESYRTLVELGIAGMLFFWLIIGGLIFSTLYWIFFGVEKVIVTDEFVQTEKAIHLYKRRRAYPKHAIQNIHLDNELFKVKRNGKWVDENRIVIRFDTPKKEVTFGRGLNETEAEFVLLELAKCGFLEENQFSSFAFG